MPTTSVLDVELDVTEMLCTDDWLPIVLPVTFAAPNET